MRDKAGKEPKSMHGGAVGKSYELIVLAMAQRSTIATIATKAA